MFATRISRKALSIVAITLLATGTAVAAAGGALPMFVDDGTEEVVDNGDADAAVVEDVGAEPESAEDGASVTPRVVDVVENNNGDIDHHGKCTAWTNGAAKDAANPSFAELQVAADAAGLTVDEYCAAFLANDESDDKAKDDSDDKAKDKDKAKDDSDDEADDRVNGKADDESDGSQGSSGNGNSGNGNSGGMGK